MFMFILGLLTMSLISTVFLLIWDVKQSNDWLLSCTGGLPMILLMLSSKALQKALKVIKNKRYKAILQKEDGSFWYCDSEDWDIVQHNLEKYNIPDNTLKNYIHLWDKKYINYYGSDVASPSPKYAPRKFWKMYTRPIPKEEIKKIYEENF